MRAAAGGGHRLQHDAALLLCSGSKTSAGLHGACEARQTSAASAISSSIARVETSALPVASASPPVRSRTATPCSRCRPLAAPTRPLRSSRRLSAASWTITRLRRAASSARKRIRVFSASARSTGVAPVDPQFLPASPLLTHPLLLYRITSFRCRRSRFAIKASDGPSAVEPRRLHQRPQ